MSQVRENSNPNCDEHVSSSTSTTTTTAAAASTTGTSSLSSDVGRQDMEISIRIPPADQQCSSEDDDLRVPDSDSDRRGGGGSRRRRRGGRNNSDLNNELRSDAGNGRGSGSDLSRNDDCGSRGSSDLKIDSRSSDLKIDSCSNDLKKDRGGVREPSLPPNNNSNNNNNNHNNNDRSSDNASDPNNDDSDPPVENYIFQEGEFHFDDDDEDDMLLVPEETHHNLLTAQEQRQLQKRRAQSGHYRKRKKSANIDSNYVPPYAKKRFRRQTSVLPSKFLLGGNIRDPLNLASLADAKVNAALNAETPKSSPLPVPVYRQGEVPVFIPKNPDDPLGLQSNEANTPYDCIAGIRKKNTKARKHRHRKKGGRRRTDSECSIDNRSEDSDAKDLKDTSVSSEEELKGSSGDPNEPDKTNRDSLTESGQSSGQPAASDGTGVEVLKSEEEEKGIPSPSKTCKASSSNIGAHHASKQLNSGTQNSKAQNFAVPNPKPSLVLPISSKQQVPGPSSVVDPKKDEKTGNSKDGNNSDSSGPINDSKSEDGNLNNKNGTTSIDTNNSPDKNNFPKRKARQRKRMRNKQGLFRFRPGFYLSGQSSDYVPLGTPSVHEANLYQFSPGGPEYFEQPFQSPSISNFVSEEVGLCMEPFSPPPKPEIKRRRIIDALPETVSTPNAPPAAAVSIIPDVPQETQVTPKAPTNCFKQPPPPSKLHIRHNNFRKRFRHKSDPIVSPVIPQPGSRRRFNQYHFGGGGGHHKRMETTNEEGIHQDKEVSGVKYRKKDEVFQYGNYNRYYGYRISEEGMDMRLSAFPKEIFASKEVIDVGCNIGHVTMLIARDYGAKRVLGIDIDPKLIEVAKKNVKHYVDRDPSDETIRFPHSCPLMYGVLQPPPGTVGDTRKIPFPYNVSFRQENYVLESDDLLEGVTPEYDVILCLSITKWIHLNNGDDGLKRFFRRAFLHLRPGGKLILEPQPWSSYKRKKKLTEQIFATFKAIRFYPDKFQDFLLKEVGFSTMEKLTTPSHSAKGFQRPLLVFTKADKAECTPKRSPSHPQLGLVEMITTSTVVPACSPNSVVSSSPPTSSTPSDQPTSSHLIKESLEDKESGDK